MWKKIPVKCQQSQLTGMLCDNDTQGAAAYEGAEGQPIYVGLCARHGRDLMKAIKANWLSVEYAEQCMNTETSTPEETHTMPDTAVPESPVPTMSIPATAPAPVDLLSIAAQLQQAPSSNGTAHTSKVVEVPASVPDKPAKHVPCEKADQLRQLAATLRAQALLAPAAAKEILKTAETMEARADRAQEAADKEAAKPAPRALDSLPLVRLALMQCGVMNLDAIEKAIDLGILSVTKPAPVKKAEGESKEARTTERPAVTHATSRGHSEDVKNRVLTLKAQGMGDNAIAREVGLTASTVYSMCKRAAA